MYDALRDRVLGGQFAGERWIREEAIAGELGVSRTPVREAIRRLEAEGLIEHKPDFGAKVRVPSEADQRHLREFRELIELHAIQLVTGKLSPGQLTELERHHKEMLHIARAVRDLKLTRFDGELRRRWIEADKAIHETLLRAAGNPYLIRAAQGIQVLGQVFDLYRESISGNLVHWLALTCLDHHRLLRSLRDGDTEKTNRILRQHLHREAVPSETAAPIA